MNTVLVSKDSLFSNLFDCHMLIELAVSAKFYSKEAATDMAYKPLSKPSKVLEGLVCPRIRTALVQKFSQSTYKDSFNAGTMTWDLESAPSPKPEAKAPEAPEMDISSAGKNSKGTKRASKLSGAYVVSKRTKVGGPTNGGDEGMYEIWKHIWNCLSFEEYFAKAPAKAQKKSGTIITAAGEMNYAVRSGFVTPVVAG